MRKEFLAISAAWMLSTAGWVWADNHATVTGKVVDESGKPVEHATVMVDEAFMRSGYSVYCPSCWVDCGKRAITDAEGSFTINGLNSDLTFKLLVLKDGYSAAFVDRADPAKGPAKDAVMKPRPPVEDNSQVVRGRVVDVHGQPVKDAVIEQQGVGTRGPQGGIGHRFGGPADWIDPVAVSNEKGEFEMAYSKPAVEITMSVTPRGMAAKLFTFPTGPNRQTLTVTDGATIRGRLVGPDGKPVANAEIGLSSHSRRAGTVYSEITIGTAEDGTFAITNVPAGRVWYAYPKMESLAARGLAGNAVPCETKDDGQEVNIGDIKVQPSYSLRGKVLVSDGKPIPPNMHVTIGSDWGNDVQFVPIESDGSFEVKGLAKGIYGVMPGIRGYQLREDVTGEVFIDRDRGNFVITIEPIPPRNQ